MPKHRCGKLLQQVVSSAAMHRLRMLGSRQDLLLGDYLGGSHQHHRELSHGGLHVRNHPCQQLQLRLADL
jgi:hypothetical protein